MKPAIAAEIRSEILNKVKSGESVSKDRIQTRLKMSPEQFKILNGG